MPWLDAKGLLPGRGPPVRLAPGLPGVGRGPDGSPPDEPGRGPPGRGPGVGACLRAWEPGPGTLPMPPGLGAFVDGRGAPPSRRVDSLAGRGASSRASGFSVAALFWELGFGPGFISPGRGVELVRAADDSVGAALNPPGFTEPGVGRGPGTGALRGPGRGARLGADPLAGPAESAVSLEAVLPPGLAAEPPLEGASWSRTRRTTGASIVEDAERTNSPISPSFPRSCLLVSPSSFASS